MTTFSTTVLGGLPVDITYTTTDYVNGDCGGLGANDIDEYYISGVNGRDTDTNWIYKRLGKNAEEIVYEKALEHQHSQY